MDGQTVEFDNTPFVVSEVRRLDCQFGKHYFKQKQEGVSSRVHLQGTRKIGCKAHIVVRSIMVYSDFQLSRDEASLGPRKLKEKKKEKLQELYQVLNNKKPINTKVMYHVLLPNEEAHHAFHQTHGAASYAQRVHPKLIEKIYELVFEGITDVQEVKRALKHHVTHVLCPDIKPDLTDRSYYPTSTDVRNHIYKAQHACQLSKLDQENLQLKIEKWKKENPESLFHFRPYKEEELTKMDTNIDSEPSNDQNSSSQTLLYVHQEPWQQDLLKRYGNTISLMDATYKTTKYELALFFVAVKTNVGYSVAAEFVVQSETAEQITEALRILSSWNPEWHPPDFMTDYSEAEMAAISAVFPNCKTYLCDFHREQSWERWVKDRKHGLSPDEGDTLLSLLRDIAQAPSPTDDNLPLDHHYHQSVDNLKKSNIWKNYHSVQEWLEGKWFCSQQVIIIIIIIVDM